METITQFFNQQSSMVSSVRLVHILHVQLFRPELRFTTNLHDAFEQRVHLAQYLIVFIPVQFDGLGRTFRSTDTTPLAQRIIDFADAVFIDSGYLVRTRPDAYKA